MLSLKPGQKVLDVGCGIGGSGFYMVKVRKLLTNILINFLFNIRQKDLLQVIFFCFSVDLYSLFLILIN